MQVTDLNGEVQVITNLPKALIQARNFKDLRPKKGDTYNPLLTAYWKDLFKKLLKLQKEAVKEANKGLIPYQGTGRCKTCGNRGLEHPQTAYCFICDLDDW